MLSNSLMEFQKRTHRQRVRILITCGETRDSSCTQREFVHSNCVTLFEMRPPHLRQFEEKKVGLVSLCVSSLLHRQTLHQSCFVSVCHKSAVHRVSNCRSLQIHIGPFASSWLCALPLLI